MLWIIALIACNSGVLALGRDQLYTGDASTVPPGLVQFQFFYNATFNQARLTGSSLTFGATPKLDAKVGYGHLWNSRGPNAELGPTLGAKWRFAGDGLRQPSASISGLYAINSGKPQGAQKSDAGGLLILQYPTPHGTALVNLGRVWVGDDLPDLSYTALAFARRLSDRSLIAAQYIDVHQLGTGPPGRQLSEFILGLVYTPNPRDGLSVQLAYNPRGQASKWNLTLGVSRYL